MNKRDFNKLYENTVGGLDGKKKLLLHACCAPCSSACLERLKEHFDIWVLFYNPNIGGDEYIKRKEELIRLLKTTGWAKLLDCGHDESEFYAAAKGLENAPEGGARCIRCFNLRLEKTAILAKQNGFDYFCTTLTISPLKNAQAINEIGERLASKYGIPWLYSDFKKKDGYKRSLELSEKFGLYRQNYCGCTYSLKRLEKPDEK